MFPLLGLTARGFSFGTEGRKTAEEERFCAALTLDRCEREFLEGRAFQRDRAMSFRPSTPG
jgi:hypothetical protein